MSNRIKQQPTKNNQQKQTNNKSSNKTLQAPKSLKQIKTERTLQISKVPKKYKESYKYPKICKKSLTVETSKTSKNETSKLKKQANNVYKPPTSLNKSKPIKPTKSIKIHTSNTHTQKKYKTQSPKILKLANQKPTMQENLQEENSLTTLKPLWFLKPS